MLITLRLALGIWSLLLLCVLSATAAAPHVRSPQHFSPILPKQAAGRFGPAAGFRGEKIRQVSFANAETLFPHSWALDRPFWS